MQICVTLQEYFTFHKFSWFTEHIVSKKKCSIRTFPAKIYRVKRRGDNCHNWNCSQDNSHWMEASFSLFTESLHWADSVRKLPCPYEVVASCGKLCHRVQFFLRYFSVGQSLCLPHSLLNPPPRWHDQLVSWPEVANDRHSWVVMMVTHRETASCFTKICKVSRWRKKFHFFIKDWKH